MGKKKNLLSVENDEKKINDSINENPEKNNQDSTFDAQNIEVDGYATNQENNIDTNISYDTEIINERLEEAKQAQSPKKKIKSRVTNAIFLLINIVLMFFIVKGFLSSLGDDLDLGKILAEQGNKLWWLAVGVLIYIIFIATEAGMFSTMIKSTTGKARPYLSYRVATIGKYYDFITPMSVGGQPFQIVALTKAGLGAGISTSLPIIKIIVWNLVYTIIILLSFVFGIPLSIGGLDEFSKFLMILFIAVAIIGLIFTALSSVLFISIGNGKIVGRGFARWIVKMGYALRIVKNYRKSYNKIMLQVREYQNSIGFLKQNKWVMFKCVLYSVVQILTYFSLPLVCIYAFGNGLPLTFEFWFIIFTRFMICQMAAVIIPLPGGTGMMEIGFILCFGSSSILGNNVVWALLAWRILSYYLCLVHGFIQTLVDGAVSSARERKLMKNSNV